MRAVFNLVLAALFLQAVIASAAKNPATSITNITIGSSANDSLFLKSNGSLWGMGIDNSSGFGIASNSYPRQLVASGVVAMAAGGDNFTLFLKSDGTVWGTGYNYLGELGQTNYAIQVIHPVEIALSNIVTVADRKGHGPKKRQCGTPVHVTAVAAGFGHSLFLESNGSLWGAGQDDEGQLGDGKVYGSFPPGPDQAEEIVSSGVTKIAAGYDFSLFIESNGSLWGMGDNSWGQLGDGHFDPLYIFADTNLPEEIVPSNVVAVAAGFAHSLFLKSDGSLWATGQNLYGQIGNGAYGPVPRPEMIVSNDVTAIAAGGYSSFFIKKDGSLWAMGDDEYGELGDSTTTGDPVRQPEEILSSNVVAIATGQYHCLFLKSDGSLWAMGDDRKGEFGDGFVASWTSVPEQILPVIKPLLIESVSSGTNLQFNATCTIGGNYYLLTGTNLAEPLSHWTPIWTNTILYHDYPTFSAILTNAVNCDRQRFYMLQSQAKEF
ncbi:MAG TPA: hypothetical protein VGY98_19600 [Verrucomicrobiae bacterium]|nr:hypothetical protein [Verrucomicrobiae bacterium]